VIRLPHRTRDGLCDVRLQSSVRIFWLVPVILVGCVDVNNICPHKPITQGVFGEVDDSSGTLEQNIEVDVYEIMNGMQSTMIGSAETTRGGYEFNLNPSMYILCSKTVCTTVTVPTGLVEVSAVDAAAGLTWDSPVAVPPEQMVGPCTFGSD
jgi:hypothetical protein